MLIKRKRGTVNRYVSRERDAQEKLTVKYQVKVGVIGMTSGAGASLIAMCLAKQISEKTGVLVAVAEIGNTDESLGGWNYDAIGVDKRFSERPYVSAHAVAGNGRMRHEQLNMDEGINWVLRDPNESQQPLDLQQLTSLIHNVAGDVVICDFSSSLSFDGSNEKKARAEGVTRLLGEMDHIIMVIDPLPSKLIGGFERLAAVKEVESKFGNVIYVLNKNNDGVNEHELNRYLKVRGIIKVPLIAAKPLYQAEYNCKCPYQIQEVKREIEKPLLKITQEILPEFEAAVKTV